VLPGAIYVVIATMAGGIVSRNRFWPVRVVTPVVVGVGAAWYFVPQTTKNVNELMWEWEKKVPRVAETHLLIREGIEDGLRRTVEMTVETKTILDDAVGKARKAAEDLVRKG
jgi:organizing structure protein 2